MSNADKSHTYRLNISSNKATFIKNILAKIESDDAKRAIAYIEKCETKARNKVTCSLYDPSAQLTGDDIVNGEIVQVLQALKFYATIYEEQTANALLAAHELILRLIRNAENKTVQMHRAASEAREAMKIANTMRKEVY